MRTHPSSILRSSVVPALALTAACAICDSGRPKR
jgi:hypothetical protein